jgi:hypothetical protein
MSRHISGELTAIGKTAQYGVVDKLSKVSYASSKITIRILSNYVGFWSQSAAVEWRAFSTRT